METNKKTDSFKDFRNAGKRSMILVILLLGVAYGMKIFHLAISHDTEAVISVPDNMYGSWIAMGRFGLVAIKYLLDLEVFNPYLASVFAFFIMAASSVLWEYLFWKISVYRKNFSKVCWVFPALFLTAPIMADQFSFLLQAFEVQIAILLVGAALFLIWVPGAAAKKSSVILRAAAACGLLIVSFSCYQSTVPLFIAGTCACFLLMFPEITHRWRALWKAVICFGAAFVLYEIISRLVMIRMQIHPTDYIDGQILWGSVPFEECVKNILRHVKGVLAGSGVFYSVSYTTALILMAVLIIHRAVKKRREVLWLILAGGLLMVSPFLMTVLMGQEPETRVQIVLPFVFGFVFQYFLLQWNFQSLWGRRLGIAAGLATLVLCLEQCVWDARIYYTEYVVYQEDVLLAVKISDRIEHLNLGESPEEPVAFVGARVPTLNPSACAHISMSGYSFFELSFSTAHGTWVMRNFMSTLGYDYIYPSTEQFEQADEYARNMPSWPDTGSVAEHDGIIIVKLSD